MRPREIRPGVQWMGAVDWNRRLFDSLIPLPDGTSYNAYLVKGSGKTALLDTVDPSMAGVLMRQLDEVDHLDYVVSHHAEQDHSGCIPIVLEKYPEAEVLCSAKAKEMLTGHLGIDGNRIRTVADGETLALGGKTLQFVYTPWVHWPETMVTHLAEDRILFSCDFFGSHLATSGLYADEDTCVIEAAKRYYAETLVETFRQTVELALSRRLSEQFEDLRTDAFMDEDFSDIDAYADRAAPAITVLIMGESNSIGVNIGAFLKICEQGTAAFEFFEAANSGFYAAGEANGNGTAELSAWQERTGSSCEAAADPVLAAEWLAVWRDLSLRLDGYLLSIAEETIRGLQRVIEREV